MSIFTKIRDEVESFFTGPVWTFLKPFVHTLESEGGPILLAAAEGAVAVGFSTTGGGAAAMTAALSFFESQVVGKGLPFIESQARALIEVALQNAKSALPVASVATPAPESVPVA